MSDTVYFLDTLLGGTNVIADERRTILEAVGADPGGLVLPAGVSCLQQIKTVVFHDEAVTKRMAVGDHYHTLESGRNELYIVLGQPNVDLCEFRWRDEHGGTIFCRNLQAGGAVYIPCYRSHSFVCLVAGTILLGYSNTHYNPAHDVKDPLFGSSATPA